MLNWSRDPIGPCFPASWRFFLAAGRHLGCHRLTFRVWFKEWGKVVRKFLNGDECQIISIISQSSACCGQQITLNSPSGQSSRFSILII
jgi:hypothetical protein